MRKMNFANMDEGYCEKEKESLNSQGREKQAEKGMTCIKKAIIVFGMNEILCFYPGRLSYL